MTFLAINTNNYNKLIKVHLHFTFTLRMFEYSENYILLFY